MNNSDFKIVSSENYIDKVEEERDVNTIYYVDYNDLTIYDKDGNIIGKIGSSGYSVNLNTNQLKKDGKVIGFIEDSRSMNRSYDMSKPHVRTLKKENKFNAAFVTGEAILLVIVLTVLLVSMVIYFMK